MCAGQEFPDYPLPLERLSFPHGTGAAFPPLCAVGFLGHQFTCGPPRLCSRSGRAIPKNSSQKVCELQSLWSLLCLSHGWGRCSEGLSLLQPCPTQAALWTGSSGRWGSAGALTLPFQPLSRHPCSFVPPTPSFSPLHFSLSRSPVG